MWLFKGLQLVLLIATTLPPQSLSMVEFGCEEEWVLNGTHCYRFVDVRLNYEDSIKVCERYGAELLYIRDEVETETLASIADDMFEGASEFWIANIRDPLCQGYWQPYEPNDDIEEERAVSSNMDGRWRLTHASDRIPFVCRTPACPVDFFRCSDGKCLNPQWKCDGENDCSDRSDENDCGDCVEYLRGNTGMIDTEDTYPNKTVCQWIIEGDPGEVLKLEFEVFDIEPEVDVLTIYVGGPSIETSIFLEEMTGTFPAKTVYSNNNFFIVRLTTDGTVSHQGIKVSWSVVPQLKPGEVTTLEASDMYQTFTSPFYDDDNVPMFITKEWLITAPPGNVITVEVENSTLDDEDMVYFSEKGVFFEIPETTKTLVVSQTNTLTIIIDARHEENIRFKARFKTGCSIESSFLQASLTIRDMPANLNCTWNISNPLSLSFSISFTNSSFDDPDDFVKVFEGKELLDENQMTILNMYNTMDTAVNIGSDMILQYYSNSLRPHNRIMAIIATECPDFPNGEHMEISGSIIAGQNYSITVSCETGYEFMQEEYNRDGFVRADCSAFGEWNFGSKSYTRYPSCQIVYCGIPNQIQNGIIIGSSGNVTFRGTAEYECFNGFTLQGSETITCQSNGSWTEPPSCEADPCSSVPDVENANYTFTLGSASLSFGAIVHYSCDSGFDLIGAQQIVCEGNGTWSHEPPQCTRLSCSIPDVEHGQFSSGVMLPLFEDVIVFTCDEGYRINGTDLQSAQTECGPDRVLHNESLSCVDKNECDDVPCSPLEVCVNHPGNFSCLCRSGYSGSPCEKTLDPYAHCGFLCGDSLSTFCCTCQDGYELFTKNGTNGFYIPSEETGQRDLDVYHINTTCVPIHCSLPPTNYTSEEAFLKTAKTIHHYRDELHYHCDFGYALPSSNTSAICNSQGIFEGDLTDQNCTSLMCYAPTIFHELELSRSPEDMIILPGQTLNITCSKGDGSNNTIVKRLFCAPTIGSPGEFSLQGDNPECLKIDCGVPEEAPGSVYNFFSINNEFGSSFEFTCNTSKGFSIDGSSSDGTHNVSCLASGRWGFGNLTCLGAQCKDPGFHAGTRYDAPNGFAIDQLVYYECLNPTYTLIPPGPRICEYGNGNATWNGSIPICIDQRHPSINCMQPSEFNLYDELMYPEVTAEDNSGFVLVYQSDGPLSSTLIAEDTLLEFTASDGTLSTFCNISITLTDLTPPTLDCQTAHVEINQSDSFSIEQIVTNASHPNLVQLSHNQPINNRPGTVFGIRASLTKENGLRRECATLVEVAYSPCSNESIANPRNGTISNCREEEDFYKCDIQCNDGFLLPDFNESFTGQCVGGIWTPSPAFFNCYETLPPIHSVDIVEVFQSSGAFTTPPASPVSECLDSHTNNMGTLINGFTDVCGSAVFSLTRIEGSELFFNLALIDMTIQITGISQDNLPDCVATLLSDTSRLLDPSDEPTVNTGDCKTPWTIVDNNARSSTIHPQACSIRGVLHTLKDNTTRCAPCGPGYYFDGEFCQACAPGSYNPLPGRDQCLMCPYNGGISPTRGGKAISVEDCEEICPPGFFSGDGYVAAGCSPCPVDEYWQNALSCASCPNSGSTKGLEGAVNDSYCHDPCPAGKYSLSGYEDCISCPMNYYSNAPGSSRCTECPSDTYTTSEGSDSASSCLNDSASCTDDFCTSEGAISCSVIDHRPRCLCMEGYSGDRCNNSHNPCDADPCYNNATCIPNGLSYSCDCPKERNCTFVTNSTLAYPGSQSLTQIVHIDKTLEECKLACEELDSCLGLFFLHVQSTDICALQTVLSFDASTNTSSAYIKNCDDRPLFTGTRCEEDRINDCTPSSCSNEDFCKDFVGYTECICPPGGSYLQPRCEPSSNPCQDNPCANGATCETYDSLRRVCFCRPGFTGENCSVNIDDCAHNNESCLYGGECVDGENGYSCICPDGFGGDNCEERGDLCESASCGENGDCISDYNLMKALCFCEDHYELAENTTNSCVPIKYCDSSPCKNNATCEDFIGDYHCECLTGYEGSVCQHNIDDCVSLPCQNEGVCQDRLNDFECMCPPGFEGDVCEINIQDCNGECVSPNFLSCENLVLDYKCICKEGFKGKNCNETILLCDNEPCRHGGECTDLIGSFDFDCDCPNGWTGKTCEEVEDFCQDHTCENQAQCYNLMDRTYCNCEDGTAGMNCERKADVCGLFSPFACLHGECSEDDGVPACKCFGAVTSCEFSEIDRIEFETGDDFVLGYLHGSSLEECENSCLTNSSCFALVFSAGTCQLLKKYELQDTPTPGMQRIKRCQYDPYYSGMSCHLQKDHCYNNTCGIGDDIGQCVLDGLSYECDCKGVKNFGGPQCQTPVVVCQPSTCPVGTICYEYLDDDDYLQPVCLCGPGELLSGNDCKSIDRDFDLLFPPSLTRNNFVTSLQGFYMANEQQITITFWIACLETPDDWVISIASAGQDPGSSEYEPFIQIFNQEVVLTESENISLPGSLVENFEWHFVRISIDSNGQYLLQYDFLTPQDDGRRLNISFPQDEYFLVHLGQSFSGYISQVSVWKSILPVNDGVVMANDKFHVPQLGGLGLGWTLYSLNVLVNQVYPSSAEQQKSVCTIDGTLATEETCPGIVFPDKTPPMLRSATPCEMEKTLLVGQGEHQVTVNMLGYRFMGGMTSSNILGDVFSYGAHDIAFTSEDTNGNIGVCMTRTYVTPNECEDTRPPEEFEDCDDDNRTVIVECPPNKYPSTPQPNMLTCGKLGSYNLKDMFQRPPRIICGECLPVTYSVTLEIVYILPLDCPSDSMETLSEEVERLIKIVSQQKWNRLCVDSDCSNADITAECSDSNDVEADVTLVIGQLPATLNSSEIGQLPLTPVELMLKLVEDRDDLDASNVFFALLKRNDFSVEDRPLCLPGHVINGDCCVKCGEGSYHNVSDDVCKLCPLNYFSNSSGQIECRPCPDNNATLQEGSSSIDDCVARCNPGEFLNATTGMCELCPSNFYQDLPSQTGCKPCPPATGTESSGSTSESECQDYCSPGTQLNNLDCVACRRGFYRQGNIQDQCKQCPENTTTAEIGSSTIDLCVIPICGPGTYVLEDPIDTYTCQVCDYGTYQNETSMFTCHECLPMYTTARIGAVNDSECVFVCPTGQEEDPDDPLTCRYCARGTYRGPSLDERFSPCQNCSGPFITDQVGSLYSNQCTVAECLPGYYLNVSDNSCYECNYGTYQPLKWQTNCSMCDPDFTTEDTASTSESQCRFVCLEGYFESSPGSETCEMCHRGTYRGSSLAERFLPCSNCSSTFTTVGPGATEMSHCNITICTAGSYRNATENLCRPCPKGQFQDEDLQLSCDFCEDNYTTNGTGKTSSNDCIFVCPEGSQVAGFESCELCGRGLFRNSSMEFDLCEPCNAGWTTDSPGASSSEQCNIKNCTAGNILSTDFSSCIPCPMDTYQSMEEPDSRTTCANCTANTGTVEGGSDDQGDCTTICHPGFGYNSTLDDCSICSQGFFNNGNLTMRFMECAACPTGFTTVVEEGATHESNCSLRDCPPGSYFNENDLCVICPVGKFQPERRQSMCEPCPTNKNTTGEGASDISSCRIFCPAGQEDDGTENCVLCSPDNFKANASFGDCTQCTGDLTSGSDRISCSQVYCDIGREFNGSQCVDCAVGSFKGSRGNGPCEKCPANTTTSSTGELDRSDCDTVFCVPGYFSPDNETCDACDVGFFKNFSGNDECTACSDNITTTGRASTREDACFLKICPPGEYRSDANTCLRCAKGFYQPSSGTTSCLPCDDGYSTEERGSTDEEHCRILCPAGKYRNDTINECESCPFGTYQEMSNSSSCESCSGNYTTLNEGSMSQDACQIQCPPGYYQSSSTQCLPCERGRYQDQPNQDLCVPCDEIDEYDESTLTIASYSSDMCLPLCPPGLYLNITSKSCIQCAVGTFKTTAGLGTICESCPEGNTTIERGSINRLSCSYELCSAGFYRQLGTPDCQKCPLGQYQPDSGVMLTSCFDCPIGKTTLIEGAKNATIDCVTDCPDGEEYNVATRRCHGCAVGTYKKKPQTQICLLCPDRQTTRGFNYSDCVNTGIPPRTILDITLRMNVTFFLNDCTNEVHTLDFLRGLVKTVARATGVLYIGFCQNAACDNVNIFIPLFCGRRRQRGVGTVKRQTGGTVIGEITATNIPEVLENNNNNERVPAPTVLEHLFLDLSPVAESMTINGVTYGGVNPAILECAPGAVRSNLTNLCDLCPAGQYHDEAGDVCVQCTKGSYSIASRTACELCPVGKTTNTARSDNSSFCVDLCPAGQFYVEDSGDCDPCLKGSFSLEGRLTCEQCPNGQTTQSDGSHDESSCNGECAFNSSACGDHGQCSNNGNGPAFCQCDESYTGVDCSSPVIGDADDGDDSEIIIGVCVGIGTLLLFILLFVFICSRGLSSKQEKKKTISSDGESAPDFKMPVYQAPAIGRSQQSNYLTFDPTMYQSDVIDIYQSQSASRDQISIS